MENRLHNVFLDRSRVKATACAVLLTLAPGLTAADSPKIDTEFFEFGAGFGFLNMEDFTNEITAGLYASFRATENFFLQTSLWQADISLSSVEQGPQGPYTGDRHYQHFNLLLGYNLFQGEVFKGKYAGLSSLYLVGGVGDTVFLDEANFTYIYGIGYQMALSRRYTLRFDYQNYQYDTTAIDQQLNSTSNSHMSVGLSWQF